MNKRAIRADTIFAMLAFLGMFYVKLYETMPKTSPQGSYNLLPYLYLYFALYDFVAIPLFYLSVSAFLTTVMAKLYRIYVPHTISILLKCAAGLAVPAFWGFVAAQTLGGRPPIYGFFSAYALYFAAVGLILALGLRKKSAV